MTITLLPDVEKVISAYLRSRAEVAALVEGRVYTEIPKMPVFPLVRLMRVGGEPLTTRPLYIDQALLQIDAFGGPKALARQIAETCRHVLSEAHLTSHSGASVDNVEFGSFQWLPDPTFEPAKPRYSFDVSVTIHPI